MLPKKGCKRTEAEQALPGASLGSLPPRGGMCGHAFDSELEALALRQEALWPALASSELWRAWRPWEKRVLTQEKAAQAQMGALSCSENLQILFC